MTAVGARPVDDVAARLRALEDVVRLGEGRLDPAALEAARGVVQRAGERLRLSRRHTVVALAGATGTGKSSLFNALVGLDLSPAGALRPTTVRTLSCVWGPQSADALLDWLQIPSRDRIARETVLDATTDDPLQGMVLLDLPDNDSTQSAHRLEVDRLVSVVDLLVWVMDPQKYADHLLHDRYLKPLVGHQDVMLVLLNQADTLPEDTVDLCLGDLRRLLSADGLDGVPVLATSARQGSGLPQLRKVLAGRVAARDAANARLADDVLAAALRLQQSCPGVPPEPPGPASSEFLSVALAHAVAVPELAEGVEQHLRGLGMDAAGWPPARWAESLTNDPLYRYDPEGSLRDVAWSEPEPWPAERPMVEAALQEVADTAAAPLDGPWRAHVRRVTTSRRDHVAEALDQAVRAVDLGLDVPFWTTAARRAHQVLLAAAVTGLAWLLGLGMLALTPAQEPTTPDFGPLPMPVVLVVAGGAGGLVLGAVSAVAVRVLARRRRRAVEMAVRGAVSGVGERLVLEPLVAEMRHLHELWEALDRAVGTGTVSGAP